MKNKWINVMLVLLLMVGTFWILKYGVKKAADMSALSPHSDSSGKSGNQSANELSGAHPEVDANGVPIHSTGASSNGVAANGSASGNGSADHSGAHSGTAGSDATVAKATKPDSNCFTFDYQHKKEARQKDIEDFLDYSNAFPILHKNINEKSICVKVNQKPVAFKVVHSKSTDEVIVGSVVGPESVIHVAYCINKANCTEACAVKSNRLMDDLMSDASDDEDFKDSWGDSEDAHKKGPKERA